jgi:hypothetical protein
MADTRYRTRNATFVAWLILAVIVIYPVSVGPLAFLQGTGALDDKAVDGIRPVYAPLTMMPPIVWLLGPYEKQCNALGRRVHQWSLPGA